MDQAAAASCFQPTATSAAVAASFRESASCSSSSTIHVFFSPSPWENTATSQSLTLMTMNPPCPSSSSSSQERFSTDSMMEELMTVSRSSECGAGAVVQERTEHTQLASPSRHSDVVDRWIEVHFQAPTLRVRSYIPPMFNIHTRGNGISIEGRNCHHRPGHRRTSRLHPDFPRTSPNFSSLHDLTERTNLFKLKKTTAMKRAPASSSRLSRERRRTSPAFAALGGYSPLSSRFLELDTIPETAEAEFEETDGERKDSGIASSSGEECVNRVMWCVKLNEIDKPIKENESVDSSEKLCDKLCEEMAELPLSDQPSAETMVTQSLASLSFSDGNRKFEKGV